MKSNMALYKNLHFFENLGKMKLVFISLLVLFWCLLDHGASGVCLNEVFVMDGNSVTLNTGVTTDQQQNIKWYFKGICIAQINGDKSMFCTDDQCNNSTEIFRDRLDLDCQTGSLTITNTRTTDSGDYKLQIISSNSDREKTFIVAVHGVSGGDTDVSVMEEDSVILYTDVKTEQQDRIRWYFNDTRIAQINRDLSKICTDVQCNEGTERFRDRLKLDNQTGSLTIMNTSITDTGDYELQISNRDSESEKTFTVALYGISPADQDKLKRKSVKEGESVTVDPGEIRKSNDSITWYFNDTLITEITGDQSKVCTDEQCDERFRDRLKLDHQTGSLTITNTRTTDSGLYHLQINSSRFSIIRSFSVTVTAVPDSGQSTSLMCAGAGGAAVLLVSAAGVIYSCCRRYTHARKNDTWMQNNDYQENDVLERVTHDQTETPQMDIVNMSLKLIDLN